MRRLLSLVLASGALVCAAETKSALEADPKGWKDLTAAKGWVRVPIPATATVNPENQWRYDPKLRLLICEGDKGREMLRSNREYKDFILHVRWRFARAEGKEQPRYNSGVFVRASANGEYFVQGQLSGGPNVWLFADYPVDGQKQRVNLRDQMTAERTRPAGEWNVFEMTVKGPSVSLWVNGATIGSYDKVPVDKGYIGLEAEGFYIEFADVKLKELR
jgi:hypothetical protein